MNTTRRGFFATLFAALGAVALKLGMKKATATHYGVSPVELARRQIQIGLERQAVISEYYGAVRVPTEVSLMKDGSLEVGYRYVSAEDVDRILAQNARSRKFQEAKLPNPDGLDGIFSWTPKA
jgi:hypothetical protein